MNPIMVPPSSDVSDVLDHLFRHEAGKIVATLTRIFGIEHFDLVEDVIQEALAKAMRTWPYYGVPQNPSAWIMRVSRNLALDVVRRQTIFRNKEPELICLASEKESARPDNSDGHDPAIEDDLLRMMFVCCHPLVPPEAQVALALKTVCGFNIPEISRAFLTSEAAIAKRLTRARQKIRDERIPFEIPAGDELGPRLDGVLQTIYLLFNEGYKASNGDKLVREDLCHEAIRLGSLLAASPAGNLARTHALLALMLFSAARLSSRTDAEGNMLLLKEQDRSTWNRAMLARGLFHLSNSASGDEITEFHLQAGIAACHCSADHYETTDWPQILLLYDRLVEFDSSPVVALNRAVALANVQGPQAGIAAVSAIPDLDKLDSYYLLYAVLGEFEARLNDPLAAAGYFRKSLELAEIKSEKAFLLRRFKACEDLLPALEEASRSY